MRVPMICADQRLRQFAAAFRPHFSVPQYQHFATMLVALMQCQARRTLTDLLRQVADGGSLASTSRFLARAPWELADLASVWRTRFDQQVAPLVAESHARQRAARPRRRGRPKDTVVTAYLIGDDSTMHKTRGKKMKGLGKHYSSTHNKPVTGHSLVQMLLTVAERQCPLEPQLYRQQAVCEAEDVPFKSKIDLMDEQIAAFVPVLDTITHVLLDSWYTCKRIWKTARSKGFHITSGLKKNRSLRIEDPNAPGGWRWQRLPDYAATLTDDDYQEVVWPNQSGETRTVWVHVVNTRVKKLYRCQVILVKETKDAPPSAVRFWASSDLTADAATLIGHIAARWAIEVLFADAKEELGLDHYQVMEAEAIRRFWAVALTAYVFLEEERTRMTEACGEHVTIGEARRAVQQRQWSNLVRWICQQQAAGSTPQALVDLLAA